MVFLRGIVLLYVIPCYRCLLTLLENKKMDQNSEIDSHHFSSSYNTLVKKAFAKYIIMLVGYSMN